MKRYTAAAAVISMGILITANAAAYGLYCENVTAANAVSGYSEQLKTLSKQFETALNAAGIPDGTAEAEGPSASELYTQRLSVYSEFASAHSEQEYSLAEKLIDYDILLKRLSLETDRYERMKSAAEEFAQKYLVGECTKQQTDEAEKQRSDKYYEIESLLFDVSALKSEIESVTGETLRSDHDFSDVYLITDALKLSPDELSDWGIPGTICAADGAEVISETADITAEYTTVVKNYYSLGEALRTYIDAAEAYQTAADEFRLGTVSSSQLDALNTAYEDAKMNALTSKADYAKSLLELDKSSGGALTSDSGTSAGLAGALRGSLPKKLRGDGLWITRRSGNTVKFSVQLLPVEFDFEDDTGEYDVIYNGNLLCTTAIGQTAEFEAPAPVNGTSRAEVVFRKNGKPAGSFLVDIYSPFGEFLED